MVATYLLKDDDGSKVETIEKSHHYMVAECRRAMLTQYLADGDVSWENILTALRKANYVNLADDIKAAEKL